MKGGIARFITYGGPSASIRRTFLTVMCKKCMLAVPKRTFLTLACKKCILDSVKRTFGTVASETARYVR